MVVLVLAVAVAALGGRWLVSSRHDHRARPIPPSLARPRAVAEPPSTEPTSADPGGSNLRIGRARPVSSPALIADAIGPRVALYSHAGDPEPGDVVDNPTFEGLPVTFLVMGSHADWIEVQISRRPNEATAWVKASDVHLHETPYKVKVDSAAHRLTLTDNGQTVLDVTVATGTGGTPTPTGTFFVDGIVQIANPNGPYGAYQLSVAAFSNVLTSFGGGNGQIAIHGTNSPNLLGSSVSHGCVRMTNADVSKLATMVGVGTPVEIS